jgi:3-hydroxy acid dehydrogenase/malonic semialdehyde reductase
MQSAHTLTSKTVFITGASSGIGAACAAAFAQQGARLLLCARRMEKLQRLAEQFQRDHGVECHVFQLDVTQLKDVQEKLNALPAAWQSIDVLINNAGLARGMHTLQEGVIADWEAMIDTNIKGLLYVTRQVLPQMVKRNSGHVINLGSIAGREVYPKGAVYCATKHAVAAITQGLRMDLLGTQVRVSLISPGMVETEFSLVRFEGDAERAANVYKGMQPLTAEDIANAILYCVMSPAHVNVSEVFVMPTVQAAATLVSRKE